MELPIQPRIFVALHRTIQCCAGESRTDFSADHEKFQCRCPADVPFASRYGGICGVQQQPAEPGSLASVGSERKSPAHSESLSKRWTTGIREDFVPVPILKEQLAISHW